MANESFESVRFEPLQQVLVEPATDELDGQYLTYVQAVNKKELDLRVPVERRLYLPIDEGEMITFRCNKLSGSYECRIKIKKRQDTGKHPSMTIPRPAKMKRIQKRQDVRVPCELDVELWELEEGTESIDRGPFSCLAVDISAGGLKIHSTERLNEGREIVMNFDLPLINESLETIFGRVIRVFDEKVGDQFVSAVKFSGLLDSQRESIVKYAFRRQIKLKREGRWVNE